MKASDNVSTSPTFTVCGRRESIRFGVVAVEFSDVRPVADTVTASLIAALTQLLARTTVAVLRVLVCVQVIAVSAAPIVSVLPTRPVVPVQARVAV